MSIWNIVHLSEIALLLAGLGWAGVRIGSALLRAQAATTGWIRSGAR